MKQKRLLLIYQNYATFVREDDRILSTHFKVTRYRHRSSKNPFRFILEMAKLKLYCLFNIYRFDIIYIWFADYHSFIPSLFGKIAGKKVVIVVGGYDAVSVPSINFGVFLKKNFRAFCARRSYKLADLILPVDESLVEGLNTYADPSGNGYPIGIRHFVKRLKGNIQVVPTGYDDQKWRRHKNIDRKKAVITIGGAPTTQTFRRKGLDLYLDTAAIMPDISFYLVGLQGKMEEMAKTRSTPNVHFMGYLPNDELPAILSSCKVFAQFSMSEGLPNTLCEAMLCECIPVGSDVNGIPKGIGDCGFILDEKNAEKAKALIFRALDADDELGRKARKHIQEHFHQTYRSSKLIQLIDSLKP